MKNVVDWAYEKISPIKAVKRKQARLQLEFIQKFENSGYSEGGASRRKNSLKRWPANSESPHEDIDLNLPLLRERSRNLYMTTPIATGAINTNRTNVIGSGLVLKPRVDYEYLGMSQKEARKIEGRIKRLFAVWSESKMCCCTGLNNFMEVQQIALLSWLLN